MNVLRKILLALWRAWFYILTGTFLVILSPFFLILSAREEWYPSFFSLGKWLWAYPILYGMGIFPKVIPSQNQIKGKSYMYVANHTSMIDIMLMLVASKNPIVFVGKIELSKIPVFGFFYKRVAIMVDRSNPDSRRAVYDSAQKRLDNGLGICIFPEGKVPEEEIILDTFKSGAFRLAIQYQIPIVAMSFPDNKERFPYSFNGSPGIARAFVHPFIPTKGLELTKENVEILKEKTRSLILSKLYK